MTPEERIHRIAEANHRTALAQYEADVQTSFEATKAANQAAEDALKAVMVLNGGAAVAMLAFIGHLASTQANQETLTMLNRPLFEFVAGTFSSVIATALAYFVQQCWLTVLKTKFKITELEQTTPRDDESIQTAQRTKGRVYGIGWTLKIVAILCGIAALAAFGSGALTAYKAFEQLNVQQKQKKWALIHEFQKRKGSAVAHFVLVRSYAPV